MTHKIKILDKFKFTDQETLALINNLINSLTELVKGNLPPEELLPAPSSLSNKT
ncbi:hypothetical protein OQX61_06135 [Pedobacter sp. PLR]|uniref:hypothetical protein n=1 Tax=Pedobacter sp. PLR TaxID=2994465 RepID=UPI00224692F8|nr:hypothetical protein [Pedobacter sp. PLR]MCX2450849.1 hypothetical protein [Pedobacter sp. PLR]